MIMEKELELLHGLQRFERRIVIGAADPDVLTRALARDPKIAYYLHSVSSSVSYSFGGVQYTFDVQYHNTEVPIGELYVVSDGTELQSVLCQSIGNYKQRLVLFAKAGLDVNAEYDKFSVVSAPFYPNYTGASYTTGRLSVAPLPYWEFNFQYRIGRVKLKMMENEMDAAVKRIAGQMFLPGMSAETKALLAHNYLAYTIRYTLKENASNLETSYLQSAYGALILKKCVCQGYAEAFKRLMDFGGVPCDIVCGQTDGSDTYHAWNILKLNGARENYHVDVTWDSTGDRGSYTYFGLRDSDFFGKRTWNREFNVPCNSPKSLLVEGRRGILRFKSQLIANGVSTAMLGY